MTSLFGASAAQPQQTGGGLFGSSTAQPQQTGGLFGASTQQQPAQGGGLFGGVATQQQAKPGGLFGSSTTQTGTGGLFGQPQQQQQQQQQPQQQAAGGLFAQSKPAGSLFSGLGQPTTQQPQSNAFGQTLGGASALGPGLTMGQSTSQQQTVPGVRIDLSNLKGTTRFNDLQEDLQKQIANIDRVIQGCIAQKNELDAFMPAHGEQLAAIPTDVKFVSRKYAGVDSALGGDAQAIKGLRDLVKVDLENSQLSFKALDNLRLPAQYHTSGLWSSRQQGSAAGGGVDANDSNSDLVTFFSKTADEMDEQLNKFQRNLSEIEMHLGGVQSNLVEQVQRLQASRSGAGASTDDKIADLAAVLRDFEESILKVAGVVGGAREGMTELQLGQFRSNGTH
ncbi:putative nucleoporin nup49 protein [Phaeoacremonium minimum UCRPA7]|uniref:Putative nucleoporin nup49 protein n=1 Tax=Phaeoacremonium minimum (strain UCR-PA7) TaxID=1286976 RepID=R8BX25_PHAM7|nr:putative nucleoporin nup49 protein [Phaeoacremonium minimum UCRPA7]EOO03844.1 putative nucleoporin nup49 protein [Phaeoacremonium minimum UCRPA7]